MLNKLNGICIINCKTWYIDKLPVEIKSVWYFSQKIFIEFKYIIYHLELIMELLIQNIGIPEHWNIRYWRVLTLTKSNKEHVSHFMLLITCRLTVTKLLKSWNLSSCSNSKVCITCTRLYMTPPGLFTVPACLYTCTYNVMSTVHGSSLYTPSTWTATLWPLCPLSWDSCFCRLRGWLGKDHWRIYT